MNDSFRYYEQDNAGASAARNKGIDNAIGEYLLFVDSDDYVDEEYFESIDKLLQCHQSDLLIFDLFFINRNQDISNQSGKVEYFSSIGAVKQISIISKRQQLYSLCDKVFVRRLVDENHIQFNTSISVGEDSAFVFQYVLHIESFLSYDRVLYYVDESVEDSLSRKERKNLCDDLIVSYKEIENHLMNSTLNDAYKKEYLKILSRAYYRSAYSCFLEIGRWNCSNVEKEKEIAKVCSSYRKNRIKPVGLDSIILSIPVLWKLTLLIRLMLIIK